ncbi:hypothetical protein NEUTE2DRAFT_58642 [Neurospora tetrasperma FGSC 2509]|nr:hypothetical protein NEUTE2DRAFT_58642 [Neurospora tetrasperma FGSC 2509]
MPNRSLRRHMSVVGSRTQRMLPLPLQGQRCDYRSGVEADEASEVAGQVCNNRRVWSLLHGCRVATVACSCEKGRVRSGHVGVLRWSDRSKQPGQHDYYLKEEGDRNEWVESQDDSGRTAQCKHTAPKLTTGAECDDVGKEAGNQSTVRLDDSRWKTGGKRITAKPSCRCPQVAQDGACHVTSGSHCPLLLAVVDICHGCTSFNPDGPGPIVRKEPETTTVIICAQTISFYYVPGPTCPFDGMRPTWTLQPRAGTHLAGRNAVRNLTGMASRCERFSSSIIHCITVSLLSNSGISNDTDLNPDVNSLTTSRQRQSDDKQPESVDGLALATRVPGLAKTTYRL